MSLRGLGSEYNLFLRWLAGRFKVDFGSLVLESKIKRPMGLNVICFCDSLQEEERSVLSHFCVGRRKNVRAKKSEGGEEKHLKS